MRVASLGLILVVCGIGCRPPRSVERPVPEQRFSLDGGTLVRLKLKSGEKLTGHLFAPFDASSESLVVCPGGCSDAGAPAIRAIRVEMVDELKVRGKATGTLGQLGFYTGGFIGTLIRKPDKSEDTGPMLLGLLSGAILGAAIGSRLEEWIPVFPCGAHNCYWPRYERMLGQRRD